MAAELFKLVGVQMVHVPYKGPAGHHRSFGGQVPVMFLLRTRLPHAQAGRLRVLAQSAPALCGSTGYPTS
jgi:tripartite-type tricarboxylate transporter receptor subunit TctC